MNSRSPPQDDSPWLPFESRRRARDEKREAVLRAAVRLFLEQGYYRATLAAVAERLNITKAALYNYFHNKEEILFECWTRGQTEMDANIAAIDAAEGTGLTKLRELIRRYAFGMTTDFGALQVRVDLHDLSDRNRKLVQAGRRRIDLAMRRYISEGMADGSIVTCDAKLSAFAIAGALTGIGHWYVNTGTWSPEAITSEFVARLTEGVASEQARTASAQALSTGTRSRGEAGGGS